MNDPEAVAALERADALHTALTHIVLEGGDLAAIAEAVGDALGCGVVFTSTDGRERAAHLDEAQRESLAAADLLDPTGRLRVERIDPDGTAVGEGEALVRRVVAAGVDLARLVALRPDGTIHSSDVHALERAAIVAALLVTRVEAITAVENKYRGDFLRDVFLGRAGEEDYVAEHAQAFGWHLDRPVLVVVAVLDPDAIAALGPDPEERRAWQDRFAQAWRQVAATVDGSIASVAFSREVVTLVPVGTPVGSAPGGPGGGVGDHGAVDRIIEAVRGDRGGGRVAFSAGVSRVANGLGDLPEAFRQAQRAVEIGRRVHGGGSVTRFDQLGLHRLLALVPDSAELTSFAADVLGPLAERTPEAADLRETLQVLLDTNFNVAEAARAQFFHYNTMRYRVGKLQRLLGPVASDPHLRLDVAVALRALEIVG
ncbi:helix-turn-helix domain-containing protein [Nocardioides sp. zg-1308]|uniref:PucR family transcriptional regulator n=1 Tax=Nocardioides sp. zg-1308 TaxID=2736253 RepID=UPI001553DAD2|nr:helix-turn-helix domain-containing protein [Nocardioides sp. zg-1308]NPD05611.1 helix-turn-helix domain-containing protein [Nocardioides sp. zg-1308]